MADEEDVLACDKCGAAVYQEHIDSGMAKKRNGQLICPHCATEDDSPPEITVDEGAVDVFEPIAFEDDDADKDKGGNDPSQTSVSAMSESLLGAVGVWDDARFKRPLNPDVTTAMRCRTFHSKLTDGALTFLNSQINQWLDANKDITIKFANSTIGPFEGKHVEMNLIVTLFY